MRYTNRLLAAALSVAVIFGNVLAYAQSTPARPAVSVFKTPTCGCCSKWVEHLQASGFNPTFTNLADLAEVRAKYGVPPRLTSCHTAVVNGYVIEGHVPASDIKRLLREKPAIVGLAAPGMPAGSPGMDVPNSPPYQIIAWDKTGKTSVYSTQTPK